MDNLKGRAGEILPALVTTPADLKQSRQKREERSDAVQNRLKILEVAKALFAKNGVEKVTMTEIADTACIGKGTLYRHFSYKGELCLALLQETSRAFQNDVLSGFGEEGRRTTALGRLYLYVDRSIDFMEQNHALLRPALENASAQHNTDQLVAYASMRLLGAVLLKEAVASGECRSDLDIEYMTDALQGLLGIELFIYQRQAIGLSVDRLKAGVRQVLEGIVTKS